MRCHEILLRDFLQAIPGNIAHVLDAGSGMTSLRIISEACPDALIDAMVYPGDTRKITSAQTVADAHPGIRIIEKDLCGDGIDASYDIVVAHLLLGEATKFGHTFEDLLRRLMALTFRYLIVIDYLEDPKVHAESIPAQCAANRLTIVDQRCLRNADPQVWEDFTGEHNFGYLISAKK